MNAVRPLIIPAAPAVTFKAWRVGKDFARNEAHPVELPDWIETAQQAADFAMFQHKEGVLVLRSDAAERPERRNLVTVFVVKRRSRRDYKRLPDGTLGLEPEHYAEPLMQFCVADGFAPVEPWRWLSGADVVGIDRTLVEVGK